MNDFRCPVAYPIDADGIRFSGDLARASHAALASTQADTLPQSPLLLMDMLASKGRLVLIVAQKARSPLERFGGLSLKATLRLFDWGEVD